MSVSHPDAVLQYSAQLRRLNTKPLTVDLGIESTTVYWSKPTFKVQKPENIYKEAGHNIQRRSTSTIQKGRAVTWCPSTAAARQRSRIPFYHPRSTIFALSEFLFKMPRLHCSTSLLRVEGLHRQPMRSSPESSIVCMRLQGNIRSPWRSKI